MVRWSFFRASTAISLGERSVSLINDIFQAFSSLSLFSISLVSQGRQEGGSCPPGSIENEYYTEKCVCENVPKIFELTLV